MVKTNSQKHILTILLEDYFQVGAFDRLIRQQTWSRFEPRYLRNTLKALDLLDNQQTKATFFVSSWIAEQSPELIREIIGRGHEIASRGSDHQNLQQISPEEFRADLRRTRELLEQTSGQKISGYRAAGKLSYSADLWKLDMLAEEGFAYDASFLPTWNAVKENLPRLYAHEYTSDAKKIWELPYSTYRLGNFLLPISGGNYFRQLPYTLLRRAVSKWHEQAKAPFVLYFHVWELDVEQPRISAASSLNSIRHYRKLDKMAWIINENLSRYQFTSCADFLEINNTAEDDKNSLKVVNEVGLDTGDARQAKNREKVSIVIPCFNEEKTLPYLANTLRSLEEYLQQTYELQFIFIDDQSSDLTFAKLRELFSAKPNAIILQHEQNKGVAAGIMTGLKNAQTDIVCSIDADCTYDPHELANMIPLLREGVALVTASPYHPAGGVRNIPAWRLSLSKVASWLYRQTLPTKLFTYTSCFRVYRRSAVENLDLKENGFLGVAEMLGKLDLQGGRIVEHPAILDVRLFGFSKMKTARTILGHLRLLSRLAVMRRRGRKNSEKLIVHKPLSKS
ncbi:MAG: glycosyltransferase [Pyrinomonadaceae bacterium]